MATTKRWKTELDPAWEFSYDWSEEGNVRRVELKDSILTITRNTLEECEDEFFAQVNDGVFENEPYFRADVLE